MNLTNNSISENNFFRVALNSLLLATKDILPRKILSATLGVSEAAISQWVTGKTFPDSSKIRGLIHLYKAQELDSRQKALLFEFMCSLEQPVHEVWPKAPDALKDQLLSDYILHDIESDVQSSISMLYYDVKQELLIQFLKHIAIIKDDLEKRILNIAGAENKIDNDPIFEKVRRLKKVQSLIKQSSYSEFIGQYTQLIREVHQGQRIELIKLLEGSNSEVKKNESDCTHLPEAPLCSSRERVFEEEVAKILQALGYVVKRNMLINNSSVDLYAEYKTGVITYGVMVECKSYREGRLVGIDEIKKFAQELGKAKECGFVHKGLLVTNNGFTANAKTLALGSGMEIITYAEMAINMVNFDSYIDQIIQDFDRSPVSSYYVELMGTEEENYESIQNPQSYKPIDKFINHCFENEGKRKLVLLGHFGTGKTTFCRKYARDIAISYKTNKTGRIPILINLKDANSKIFIDELILYTLQYQFGIAITKSTFYELQRQGKFIFLLDGFDEMDGNASPETVSSNFRELDRIAEINENKFILTCRTNFFRNKLRLEGWDDFSMLYIPEWGECEIQHFLQKKFNGNWKEYLNKISDRYNLLELAQTPLFLEMIAETLPLLGDQVKKTELYKIYTDQWFRYQAMQKSTILSTEERRNWIKDLAMKLYVENRLSCHYTELEEILKKSLKRIQPDMEQSLAVEEVGKLNYLSLDLQQCVFLVRNPAGDYSFAHTSFLEYFVAEALAEELNKGIAVGLESKILPITIRGFLIDFIKDNNPKDVIVDLYKTSREGVLRENIVALASFLKIHLPHINDESSNELTYALLLKFIQGETKATSQIFEMFYSPLYTLSMSIVRDKQVAEDIIADVFTRLWMRREAIENVRHIKSYLLLVARNCSIDYLRRSRTTQERLMDSGYQNFISEEEKHDLEAQESFSLDHAIKNLPEKDKPIAIMLISGYSNSEIASKMGLSMKAIRNKKSQAIISLKKVIVETIK